MGKSMLVIILSLWLVTVPVVSGAAIPAGGIGARPLGMGKAFVAVSDDANTLFINPAGLAYAKRPQITSMYSTLSQDTSYTLMGGVMPTAWGNLGLGYTSFGVHEIILTGVGAMGRGEVTGSTSHYNNIYQLSYGRKIWDNLSAGLAFKFFSQGFNNIAQSSASGFDMDVGLLYLPSKSLSLGVAQQNTLPFDVASLNWQTGAKDSIPSTTKIGLAFCPSDQLTTALDADLKRGEEAVFYAGAEWRILKNFALRAGKDKIFGDPQQASYTAGLGLGVSGIKLDYAYYFGSPLLHNSAHYLSFSYREKERTPKVLVKVPPALKKVGIPLTAGKLIFAPPVEEEKKKISPEKGRHLYLLGQAAKYIHYRKFEKAHDALSEYLVHYPYSRYAKHLLERVDLRIAAIKEAQWITYKVKKGDTLWELSKEHFGDPFGHIELATYNKVRTPRVLQIGEEIFLPQQDYLPAP